MIRALLLAFLFPFSPQFPAAPRFVINHELYCGVRLYDATHVQTWCYHGTSPADPALRLVHNTITELATGTDATWSNYILITASFPESTGTLDKTTLLIWANGEYQILTETCQPPPPSPTGPPAGPCAGDPIDASMSSGTLAPAQ